MKNKLHLADHKLPRRQKIRKEAEKGADETQKDKEAL